MENITRDYTFHLEIEPEHLVERLSEIFYSDNYYGKIPTSFSTAQVRVLKTLYAKDYVELLKKIPDYLRSHSTKSTEFTSLLHVDAVVEHLAQYALCPTETVSRKFTKKKGKGNKANNDFRVLSSRVNYAARNSGVADLILLSTPQDLFMSLFTYPSLLRVPEFNVFMTTAKKDIEKQEAEKKSRAEKQETERQRVKQSTERTELLQLLSKFGVEAKFNGDTLCFNQNPAKENAVKLTAWKKTQRAK